MKKVTLKEELLKMRFTEIYQEHKDKILSCEQAALILGMSERTFFRKRQRFEEDGFDGVFDKRLKGPTNNQAADAEVEELNKLYTSLYKGFTVQHFYEYYKLQPNITRSYNWCRLKLQESGLIMKSTKGGKHRLRRPRKPLTGMMLHQDASTHLWIEALDYNIDLVVTMDDADSEITSAFFCEQEGTESSLQGIKETIVNYGLFCSFYTDRGTHYAYTPEAGGKVDKSRPTQVGMALKQLGIRHIHAYSPEARGRSERMFCTLQGRLPKELTLNGIMTMEEANRYLKEVYLPKHNNNFSKPVEGNLEGKKTAYVAWLNPTNLDEILCIKEDRTVGKDNTIHYRTKTLQICANEYRATYVKAEVEVREYLDKTLGVFYGHQCIGRYDQMGNALSKQISKIGN